MGTTSDLVQLLRMCWSLFLGNVIEWYEFAIYAELEPYLQKHFFGGSEIATWMGFAVTFLARPLGGILLGILGDIFGRKVAVNLSIVGMLVATCGQGILPTFSSGSNVLGYTGLAFLVVFRFLQGLSASGEISTISTYITEVGPPRALGRSIAFISITCNLGFLAAKAVVYAARSILGSKAMMDWGWRIPFVLAIVPGSVAVWGRRWLPESPAFEEARSVQRASAEDNVAGESPPGAKQRHSPKWWECPAEVLRCHKCSVLLGMAGVVSYAVLQYGGFVWMTSYLAQQGLNAGAQMEAGLFARGIMMLLALPVGWLADIKGVGWVTFCGGVLQAVASLPLFAALAAHPRDPRAVLLCYGVGYGLVGSMSGTVFFDFVVELFPTQVRAAGVGLSYNLGYAIFGGFAPMVATILRKGHPLGPGFLHAAAGLTTACSIVLGLQLQRRGVLRLAYVRPSPYFSGCEGKMAMSFDGTTRKASDDKVAHVHDLKPGS